MHCTPPPLAAPCLPGPPPCGELQPRPHPLGIGPSLSSSGSGLAAAVAGGGGAFQSPAAADGPALLLAASEHMGAYRRAALAQPAHARRTADGYRTVGPQGHKRRGAAAKCAPAEHPPKQSKAEVVRLRQEAATREAKRYACARFECAFDGCGSRLNRASDARTHARNFHGSWYESCKQRGLPCYVDRGEVGAARAGPPLPFLPPLPPRDAMA